MNLEQELADEITHTKHLEQELALTQVQLVSAKALLNLHCAGCAFAGYLDEATGEIQSFEHQPGCLIGKLLTGATV